MKIISLFCGCGGFDLGMKMAGHTIVWANEWDDDACETYVSNVCKYITRGDICNISSGEIPNGDIVIGGFPCQGFSLANKKRSIKDERNILYKEFCRIVEEKKPKYFLAENVRGILSLGKGQVIKTIIKDFEGLGYRVKYRCFNTADYGVPQTRVRVIIAGTRNDLPVDSNYVFPEPSHSKVLDPQKELFLELQPWVSIAEALKNIPEPGADGFSFKNHYGSKYKITNRNYTGHRTTDPHKPSPTILARGNGKGGVCALQHPNNHRRLTIRESAVVQTFPLEFEFFGSMNSCYRQIGNAVPVLFAKKLGLMLI